MLLVFPRRIRHPFYPALKLIPAVSATGRLPALCGALEDLCQAARTGIRVDRAVFPLLAPSCPFLSEADRDRLWRLFEVPIYALVVDPHKVVVACECEAQDGIHLHDDLTSGLLFGRVVSSPCDCGRPGPRLLPVADPIRAVNQAS